jgi:hypothetical protein
MGGAATRIQFKVGYTELAFRTAAELRDALGEALAEGRRYGTPIIRLDRETEVGAWRWVGQLMKRRTDWHEAVGLALQHAVLDGDDLTRKAFVDLLACEVVSIFLLPWTEPVFEAMGDLEGTHTLTGWGLPEQGTTSIPRLERVIAAQKEYHRVLHEPGRDVLLEGFRGPKSTDVSMSTPDDLRRHMRSSARRGRFVETEWGSGPWSWLNHEVLFTDWVDAALDTVLPEFVGGSEEEVLALLDWLYDQQNLWRRKPVLDALEASAPPWWGQSASTRPASWQQSIRPSFGFDTLGEVVQQLSKLAREQLDTPAVTDLKPRL